MVSVEFGDIVLAAGGPYSSKPRPVLVFQSMTHPTGESVVVVPLTSLGNAAAHYRVAVHPTADNGLDRPCWLEIDKVSAIRLSSLGPSIGVLDIRLQEEAMRLARQLMSPRDQG